MFTYNDVKALVCCLYLKPNYLGGFLARTEIPQWEGVVCVGGGRGAGMVSWGGGGYDAVPNAE